MAEAEDREWANIGLLSLISGQVGSPKPPRCPFSAVREEHTMCALSRRLCEVQVAAPLQSWLC